MQVQITCRHGSIGQDFHDFIEKKTQKLLNYFERVTAIQVTLDFVDDRVRVEILVDAEHKHDFVTHDEGLAVNVSDCFEHALNKMEQQIRKYKEKVQDHRRDRPISEIAESGLSEAE